MNPRRAVSVTGLFLVALSFASIGVSGQSPARDYSSEPFVIEQWHRHARFETDGTGRLEQVTRVRIQREEGLQAWGQLAASYNTFNERLDPPEVTVHKADGSTITVDAKSAQDIALPVELAAPTYTGYRQRHISVPSLRPGDSLTFKTVTTITQPLVPGHFWKDESLPDDVVVLDARFTLDLPADRRATIKVEPALAELTGADAPAAAPGRVRRAWKAAVLETDSMKKAAAKADDETADVVAEMEKARSERPALRMSSFESWDQIARWYAGLVSAAAEPDESIKAKAAALTSGKQTPDEKLRALYGFVALEVRYVSLSLGLNAYQPHKASDTLRDLYGDCKDKHTLFAALARAAGLTVEPVLIHSITRLDPDVPSPAQFDHVISVVPGGADRSQWTWLDTTPGVAPYRMVMEPLRGQTVLVAAPPAAAASAASSASAAGSSSGAVASRALAVLPKAPAIEAGADTEILGALDDRGTLDIRVSQATRGDIDLFMRIATRDLPKSQWPAFGEGMQKQLWFGGTISEFTPSAATATHEPFRLTYRVKRESFIDRTKSEYGMYLPMDRPTLVFAREKDWTSTSLPRPIGGPIVSRQVAKIALPATFTAKLPSNVDVVRPYGRYTATYALDGHTLVAERTIRLSVVALDPSQAQDYLAFARAMQADLSQTVRLTMPAAAPREAGETATASSGGVQEIHRAAYKAYQDRRFPEALALYTKEIEAEPKKGTGLNDRGLVYLEMKRLTEAEADFKQQIALNAFDPSAYNNLARVYWQQRKYDEATASFKKQIEINPLDKWAHRNLGQMESERQRYAEALPSLEKAAGITSEDPGVRVMLGTAYLETKALDEARASFDKAIELSPTPPIWNSVAYQMSLRDFNLDGAAQYAESAIGSLAIQMRLMTLDTLKPVNLWGVASFAAYWDTLGWIHFRRGDLAQAEKYLAAAWQLDPRPELGRHVGALREKQGRPRDAMRAYAEALVLDQKDADARARLEALAKAHPADAKALSGGFNAVGRTPIDFIIDNCRSDLTQRRTVKLDTAGLAGPVPPAGTVADVFLLFDSASPAISLKFVKPQPAFAPLEPALKAARYPVSWPSDAPTKLVRRAIVGCDAAKVCTVVLIPPDNTRSID